MLFRNRKPVAVGAPAPVFPEPGPDQRDLGGPRGEADERCGPPPRFPLFDCVRVAVGSEWLHYAVSRAIAGRPVYTHAVNLPARSGGGRDIPVKGGGLLTGAMAFAGQLHAGDACGHMYAPPAPVTVHEVGVDVSDLLPSGAA